MKDSEIYVALSERLVNANFPMKIVPPNMDDEPIKPYLIIDVVPVLRNNRALSEGVENSSGFCQITLVSETNEDIEAVKQKAEEVAAVFPHRLRLGDLLLPDPPMVEKGYKDGPDWRTPIMIAYETHTQT